MTGWASYSPPENYTPAAQTPEGAMIMAKVHRTVRATINLRDPNAGGARGGRRQWKSPRGQEPARKPKTFIK